MLIMNAHPETCFDKGGAVMKLECLYGELRLMPETVVERVYLEGVLNVHEAGHTCIGTRVEVAPIATGLTFHISISSAPSRRATPDA